MSLFCGSQRILVLTLCGRIETDDARTEVIPSLPPDRDTIPIYNWRAHDVEIVSALACHHSVAVNGF